jgi:peptidoglycan/xylan/chitin deacetylase (PgdA/CDA1 family)
LVLLISWQPRFAVRLVTYLHPEVVFFVDTDQPLVALTIDDGPHPVVTPELLDLLAEHEARATFFLIGERVAGNEAVVRRLVREGHEVGNHDMADRPSIGLSPAEFRQQLLEADKLLTQFGPVRLFRPGWGWFDRRMIEQLGRHSYTLVLGTAYPEDLIASPGYLSQHILLTTRPGTIVVLHDGPRRGEQTLAVLRRVLPELRRRGYTIVAVSELMAAGQTRRRMR